MIKLTLERFGTDENHYYLRLNGRSIAVICPSDIKTIVDTLATSEGAKKHVAKVLEAYYNSEGSK